MRRRTVRGYDMSSCASALQKAIRRNDPRTAGYFALELVESGMRQYVWRRLLVVSAEDVGEFVTAELRALQASCDQLNDRKKPDVRPTRVFIGKAIMLLCEAGKSRDTDHLSNLVYDRKSGIDDEQIEAFLVEARDDVEHMDVPDYAFDVHTWQGRRKGKTKDDFFREEAEALNPRLPGIFDADVESSTVKQLPIQGGATGPRDLMIEMARRTKAEKLCAALLRNWPTSRPLEPTTLELVNATKGLRVALEKDAGVNKSSDTTWQMALDLFNTQVAS